MDLGLNGKRALVTGSTAGIGYAVAEALAREGARVIVNGRTQARVDAALAQLRKAAPQAQVEGVAADVGTADGAARLIAAQPDVDVLVNNMGIFEPKAFADIPDADWMRFFEVNVLSGARLARAYFPAMLESGWGRVIFIASESAVMARPWARASTNAPTTACATCGSKFWPTMLATNSEGAHPRSRLCVSQPLSSDESRMLVMTTSVNECDESSMTGRN